MYVLRMDSENMRFAGRDNRGYTLVELIVTITIISIILSMSVMGMLSWQDWSGFYQQNEYAQTLFMAAQNYIVKSNANGSFEEFERYIVDVDGNYKYQLEPEVLIDEREQRLSKERIWGHIASGAAITEEKYRGTLCSICCDAGDYERYLDEKATNSETAFLVFSMLEDFVSDTEILNGCIAIEFTPDGKQIYSVCYSNWDTGFVYSGYEEELQGGRVNISNREEGYRQKRKIGYYGVDTLSKGSVSVQDKLELANVELVNRERLELVIKNSRDLEGAASWQYFVEVYDADKGTKALEIKIDSSWLLGKKDISKVNCGLTKYLADKNGNTQTIDTTCDMLAYLKGEELHIILDAVDIQATSYLYRRELKKDNPNWLKGEAGTSSAFASTYSFHRFGLDANNIYCIVTASGGASLKSAAEQSNTSSVYFGNYEKDDAEDGENVVRCRYEIENARHMYNMRYILDLSEEELKIADTSLEGKDVLHSFSIMNDISWDSFVKEENLYFSEGEIVSLSGVYTGGTEDTGISGAVMPAEGICVVKRCPFPSMAKLNADDELDGHGHTISEMQITEKMNVLSGVYALEEHQVVNQGATGLFVKNEGSIQDICLKDWQVQGSSEIGLCCGVNEGTIGAEGKKVSCQGTVCGEQFVGGIAGNNSGTIESASFSGEIDASSENEKLIYAGGIVGVNEEAAVINNCSLGNDQKTSIRAGSGSEEYVYVGGLAGENCGIIKRCLAVEDSEVTVIGYSGYIGGIVGHNAGKGVIGGNNELDAVTTGQRWRVESISAKGESSVAGIVGCNESMAAFRYLTNYATVVNEAEEGAGGNTAGIVGLQLLCDFSGLSDGAKEYSVQYMRCENHGNIQGNEAASGIVCKIKVDVEDILTIAQFEYCINSGVLRVKAKNGYSAGITTAYGDTISLKRCQNYGFAKGHLQSAGIVYCKTKPKTAIRIEDCFDNSHGSYPFTNLERKLIDIKHCYFIDDDSYSEKMVVNDPTVVTIGKRLYVHKEDESDTYSVWETKITGLSVNPSDDSYRDDVLDYEESLEKGLRARVYEELSQQMDEFLGN